MPSTSASRRHNPARSATTGSLPNTHTPAPANALSNSVTSKFVPHEGEKSAMDEPHPTPDATLNHLDHQALMQLQIFNIALAHKLLGTLREAKAAHEKQEATFVKKRSVLLSLLQTARDSESSHVATIHRLHDRFYSKMQDACRLQGTAKENAQTAATRQLESLAEFSQMASAHREKIEHYRNELNDLDNARAVSRNTYSDAVHAVLVQALGDDTTGKHAMNSVHATPLPDAIHANQSTSKNNSVSMNATTLPDAVQADSPTLENNSPSMTTTHDDRKDGDAPISSQTPKLDSQWPMLNKQKSMKPPADAMTEKEASDDFWLPESLRNMNLEDKAKVDVETSTTTVRVKKKDADVDVKKNNTNVDAKNNNAHARMPAKQETYAEKVKGKALADKKTTNERILAGSS